MRREMSSGAEVGSLKMISPEVMDNPCISDHDNSDCDSDIPHFSDIEAMVNFIIKLFMFTPFQFLSSLLILDVFFQILEMDLAYSEESCITSEGNALGILHDL